MATFDVFISHSSKNKELARFIFYNGISNGLKPWFDEALLIVGEDMKPRIRQAIANSAAYLLLHSKEAMTDRSWVPFEMQVAMEEKKHNEAFRIITIKLDDRDVPEWR